MEQAYEETGTKQRMIGQFSYVAKSWDRERRLITRLEFGALPFGKYCRSKPLVFSLMPRCQGL